MSLNPKNYHLLDCSEFGRVNETFNHHLPVLDGGSKILDLGCNVGDTTLELSSMYFDSKVYGIDINSSFIENWKNISGNLEFILGDGYKSLKPRSFDLVVAMNNLSFELRDYENRRSDEHKLSCLKNSLNLVKDGGYMAIADRTIDRLIIQRDGESFKKILLNSGNSMSDSDFEFYDIWDMVNLVSK